MILSVRFFDFKFSCKYCINFHCTDIWPTFGNFQIRKYFCYFCCFKHIFCLFYRCSNDSYILASILFSISLLGFMMSNVFYDSMLLNFESDNYDAVSSMGYAFGFGRRFSLRIFSSITLYARRSLLILSSKR